MPSSPAAVPPAAPPLPATFWAYLSGLTLTGLAYSVVSIALPFVVLGLHPAHPEGAVGATVLAGSLPLFLGPLVGSLADRVPARRLLQAAPLLRGLLVAGAGLLTVRGDVCLEALLALSFLNGLLTTLSVTAAGALLPRLVPPARLAQANSLQSGGLMGAPLVGYGLGCVLVHALGAGETLLLAAPFIASLAVAARALPTLPPVGTPERGGPGLDLLAAARVMRASPLLLGLVGTSFLLNLAMNLMNVRAPLFMRAAGRGAADYAVFEMLISGGVLLGILLVTPLARRLTLDGVLGVSRWVLPAGMAALVLPQVGAWWTAAAVFGVGLGLLEVAAVTRIQELIPDHVRGRVMGTFLGVNAGGLSLGAALAGWTVPTAVLMTVLSTALLLLALGWPLVARAEARRARPVPALPQPAGD